MPMGLNVQTLLSDKLLPLYPQDAAERPVNLAPSTTFAKGTVLGIVTTAANDVQTISDVPTITAGTFTISGVNPLTGAAFTTAAIAYNAANSAVKSAVETAAGLVGPAPTITMSGGTLPGTDTIMTFGGNWASLPVQLMTISSAGLTGGTLSIAHTTIGRTANTFAAYNDANSDGTQTAKAILPYACVTDSMGNISIGAQSGGGATWGETYRSISVYFGGSFDTSKLVGLDANGVTDLGRLSSGTTSAGVLEMNGPR